MRDGETRDVIYVDYEPGSEEEFISKLYDSAECMFDSHPELTLYDVTRMEGRLVRKMMIDCGFDYMQ